jgi:hypothetical protein
LVNSNFTYKDWFWSFTFDGKWQDIKKANYYFMKFIQRLKYYNTQSGSGVKLKYVCGVEFQSDFYHNKPELKKMDGGNVHYHMIMNLDIRWKELWRLWADKPKKYKMTKDDGFYILYSPMDSEDSVKNVGAYFCKHLKKYDKSEIYKLAGQKKYFCSRGLKRPITFLYSDQIDAILLSQTTEIPDYEADQEFQDGDKINYKTYTLLYPDLYILEPELTDRQKKINEQERLKAISALNRIRLNRKRK